MAKNNLEKEIKEILTKALLPTWEKYRNDYTLEELKKMKELTNYPLRGKIEEEIAKREKEKE